MNPWAAVIGAALGAVRANSQDKQNQRDNRVSLTREQWSPYTGVHGGEMKNADYMGTIMQGAASGAAMGQSMGGGEQAAAPAAPTAAPAGDMGAAAGPNMSGGYGSNPEGMRSAILAGGGPQAGPESTFGKTYPQHGAALVDPSPLQGVEVKGDPGVPYPDQFDTSSGYPPDYTGYDKNGKLLGSAKKPVNVGGKGQNFYKPKPVSMAQNDARDQSGTPVDPYRVYPPEITSGSFNRAIPPTSINGVS